MKYYYCLNPKAFFTDDLPGVIESNGLTMADLIEISENDYNNLFNPPSTMYMVFDDTGPHLEELPATDFVAIAEMQRDSLLSEMQTATYTLNMKLNLGRTLTNDEKATLNAWLDYADALNALDLSTAPNITWPDKPNQ